MYRDFRIAIPFLFLLITTLLTGCYVQGKSTDGNLHTNNELFFTMSTGIDVAKAYPWGYECGPKIGGFTIGVKTYYSKGSQISHAPP